MARGPQRQRSGAQCSCIDCISLRPGLTIGHTRQSYSFWWWSDLKDLVLFHFRLLKYFLFRIEFFQKGLKVKSCWKRVWKGPQQLIESKQSPVIKIVDSLVRKFNSMQIQPKLDNFSIFCCFAFGLDQWFLTWGRFTPGGKFCLPRE